MFAKGEAVMYIERKKSRNEAFWIIRFIDGEEKQDFVQSISDCISNYMEDEWQEKYKSIVHILDKAQHNEKYDENAEESAIISSSQIVDMLEKLLWLLFFSNNTFSTARQKIENYKIIDKNNEMIIENYEKAIKSYRKIVEKDTAMIEKYQKLIDEIDEIFGEQDEV